VTCVPFFAVRISSHPRQKTILIVSFYIVARQKKWRVKKWFVVRFYIGARQTNSLSCIFFLAHVKQFFPTGRYPVILPSACLLPLP
jgi:hypothetical protein